MENSFKFRQFTVRNENSALKVGTDAVLLGASMTIKPSDRYALDIGTGTGVIALMAAQRSQSLSIEAIDIDAPSASEAKENFAESAWHNRLSAFEISLSDYRPSVQFDLIFSNPPFYDKSLVNPDPRESAARHTQTLSYREILSFADRQLSPNGRLSMILPAESESALRRLAASFGLYPFHLIRICTTIAKKPRRIIVELSHRQTDVDAPFFEEVLTLMDGGQRTSQYEELTKDFYL